MTTGFLLERAILAALCRGTTERFELPAHALPRLCRVRDQAASGSAAAAELYRVLQLVVALRESLDSPTAAARLEVLAHGAPEVLDQLRQRLGRSRSMDETRRFLRSEGREVALRAPGLPESWRKRAREAAREGEDR